MKKWAPLWAVAGAILAPGYVVGLLALAAFAPRWLALAVPTLVISIIGAAAGWTLADAIPEKRPPVRSEATITDASQAPGMNP